MKFAAVAALSASIASFGCPALSCSPPQPRPGNEVADMYDAVAIGQLRVTEVQTQRFGPAGSVYSGSTTSGTAFLTIEHTEKGNISRALQVGFQRHSFCMTSWAPTGEAHHGRFYLNQDELGTWWVRGHDPDAVVLPSTLGAGS